MSVKLISFDFSMSCPCMCLSCGSGWENSNFYYLNGIKKSTGIFYQGRVVGELLETYLTEEERYDKISDHFISILDKLKISSSVFVYIEGYSMGSKGKIFAIAENMGLIKHKLYKRGHHIISVPPTVIKKYAGKGNSDKSMMYDAFVKNTGINLIDMTPNKKLGSPVTDIVDAYFLAQYAMELSWK